MNDSDYCHGLFRISSSAFTGTILTTLAIAGLICLTRLTLTVRYLRSFGLEEALLLLALLTAAAAAGVYIVQRTQLYQHVAVNAGCLAAPADYTAVTLRFSMGVNVGSGLAFVSIFAVKTAFMVLFKRLTGGLREYEIPWWIAMVLLLPGSGLCIWLSGNICPGLIIHGALRMCTPEYMSYREVLILRATAAIDLCTDVLIIFVPLYLLYRVRITPRRKIAYASLLCLSIFMVIICVIRVSAGELPNGTGDQVWIIFWTAVEATTAVIMFSLTALPRLIKKARRSRARAAAEAAGRGANVRVAPLATAARRRMERRLERSRDWFRSRTGTRANREEIEDGWAAEERGVEAKGPRPPGPVLLEWRNGDDMTLSSTSSTPPKPIELQRWNAGHTI